MIEVFVVAAIIGFGFLLVSSDTASGDLTEGAGTAPVLSGPDDDVPAPNWNMYPHATITSDVHTWPSGDRIWDIARAIARAEGANVSGSAPDRNNNPGDISDGSSVYGYDPLVTDSKVTHFPDKDTGWQWLYNKISNAASGNSTVYKPDMTWLEIGQKWAGDWQSWVTNVTANLGVLPTSTLREYLG